MQLKHAPAALCAICALFSFTSASAQLLFRDDFANSGNLDTTVWRLPFEGEGTFVGRTQYQQTTIPQQGIAEALATSDGLVTEIYLDTYSMIDPGNQFLGTDLLTKRNFARGGGLSFEASMRLKPTTVGGLVNGFFTFDVGRDVPAGSGTFVRDEIDWELLSNQAVGATPNQDPFTNVWNDGTFSSGGSGQFIDVPGLDLTQFHDYRVDWTPSSLRWYVDDMLVRTQTTNIPDDPMKLHFNLWAPDSTFAAAFNGALNPAATPGANQRFTSQIDYVEVNRFNTTSSAELLSDPSFEDFNVDILTAANGGQRDIWLQFGKVFIEGADPAGTNPAVPDAAVDGDFMAKMFGPFTGGPDASGILQNVAAQPGQEFEASVFVQTALGDSIAGMQNFDLLSLSFLDAAGNVINESFGSPGNMVPKNGKDFPLLDGRDTNMPEDEWVQGFVNAVAPAGTASARLSLFFIQLAAEGGASWFDSASLVRLTADPTISGDFDGNGVYECDDIDSLVAAIAAGKNDPNFDLTQDGLVNLDDRNAWLAEAGENNLGPGRSYLLGDANLDSVVDGQDFIVWNTNKFTTVAAWCDADFNADGTVDGQDFIVWNNHKFQSADSVLAVPEPTTIWIGLLTLSLFARRASRPLV